MTFSYVGRSQIIISAYLVFKFATTIFIVIPLWLLRYALPSQRPRKTWTFKDALLVRLIQRAGDIMYETGWDDPPDAVKAYNQSKNNDNELGFVWVEGVSVDYVKGWVALMASKNSCGPAKVSGYWYGKRDNDGRRDYSAQTDEKVIYELHGGGYVTSSAHPKYDMAPVIPSLISACSGIVARGFAIEYRLCSAHPFPAKNPFPTALLDALAGYRYLVEDLNFKPENIIVEGFSAGAHLAIDLVLYLKEAKIRSLPAPALVLLISPMVDIALTYDGSESSAVKNEDVDILVNAMRSGYPTRALRGSIPETEFVTNCYLSPGSKQVHNSLDRVFADWPKTLMLAGDSEAILDGANAFYNKLLKDNQGKEKVWFKRLLYKDMPHGFIAPYAFKTQREKAMSDIRTWIKAMWED